MKLGRTLSKPDRRTLWLSDYLIRKELPPLPPARNWGEKVTVPWGVMKNDEIGDCVLAAAGHMDMVWHFNSGHPYIPPDSDIVRAYSEITGYDPSDPTTDRGTSPLEALKYWRNTGIGGHKIGAFVALNPKRQDQIRHATNLFGAAFMAVALPSAVRGRDLWDVPWDMKEPVGDWAPWSWGGHMIASPKFDTPFCYVVTWGTIYPMSWEFSSFYCDEAYAVLSPEMLDDTSKSPLGFNMDQLRSDLMAIPDA